MPVCAQILYYCFQFIASVLEIAYYIPMLFARIQSFAHQEIGKTKVLNAMLSMPDVTLRLKKNDFSGIRLLNRPFQVAPIHAASTSQSTKNTRLEIPEV